LKIRTCLNWFIFNLYFLPCQTVENHLGRYIETGELKIEEFIDAETLKTIKDYFKKNPNALLSEAKSKLPDEITWSQLNLVQHYIRSLSNKKQKY